MVLGTLFFIEKIVSQGLATASALAGRGKGIVDGHGDEGADHRGRHLGTEYRLPPGEIGRDRRSGPRTQPGAVWRDDLTATVLQPGEYGVERAGQTNAAHTVKDLQNIEITRHASTD